MRRPSRRWPRLFARLVRLLPAADREAIADALVEDFDRGWRMRWDAGDRWGAVRFGLLQTADLAWNVVAGRLGGVRDHRKHGTGGGGMTGGLGYDVRITLRGLARAPWLVGAAVVTLGLGIGANLALATLVHAVLVEPLPYEEPEELVALYLPWDDRELGGTWTEIDALDRDAASLAGVAGVLMPGMDDRTVLELDGRRELVEGIRVSPNFFSVLGVRPALGPGVDAPGPLDEVEPSLLLSHAGWARRFGGDPAVVGRTFEVQGLPHVVAGVLPEGFAFQLGALPPELYVVRTPPEAERADVENPVMLPVARRAPGTRVDDVQAELDAMAPALDRVRGPSLRGYELGVRGLREHLVGDLDRPLRALAAAAVLVLLVACANLATLFLARHGEREGARAIRTALGAGRARLARLPLLEAGVLGLAGGGLGLAFAVVATDGVLRASGAPPFGYDGFPLGVPVVLLAASLAVAAGLGCGAAPAWLSARVDTAGALRRVAGRGGGAGGSAPRALAGVQASALVVLLVASGLSLRSLSNLLDVDLGFDPRGRAAALLLVPDDRRASMDAFGSFLLEVEEAARSAPGVRAAGTITHLPLDPRSWGGLLAVEGREELGETPIEWELASPGYFEAMGIRLLRGRVFERSDAADTRLVTVVGRTLAEQIRPDGDVLGTRISGTGAEGPWMEIVGVVDDVRQRRLATRPRPYVYVSHAQMFAFGERALVVDAGTGDPLAALAAATAAVRRVEPDLVVTRPRPLTDLRDRASRRPRVVGILLTAFGGISLVLALTGLYGIVAFAVTRQRRALGIRACLGAARSTLLVGALSTVLIPVGLGVVAGLAAVVAAAPWAEGLLHEVSPLDPAVLVGAPALLVAAAALAAWGPARRAATTDPASVVRGE